MVDSCLIVIKYLKLAEKEANKSNERYKLGCLLIKNGHILGRGFNINKSHPKYGSGYHDFLHAEGRAILNAVSKGKNLIDSSALVFRRNSLLAKPCKDCMKLLKKFGIKEVYYTNNQLLKREKLI